MKTLKIYFAVILCCSLALLSLPIQAEMVSEHSFAIPDSCPTAQFSVAGTPIRFINESINGQSYVWDFGDGSNSSEENPTHVYQSAGTYTVRLLVMGGGCTLEFIGTEEVIIM